jgi:hypothetical protein
MEIDKYKASIIGSITTAICLVIYWLAFTTPVFLFFPFLFNISFLPFYFLGEWIFGGTNYFMTEITVLVCEFILLLVLCGIYFRKLIRAEKRKEKFNSVRLIVFFVFLQFLVHPIGFFSWLLSDYTGDKTDEMIFLYCLATFPYSGCVFIIFGIGIDLFRNHLRRKYGDSLNS